MQSQRARRAPASVSNGNSPGARNKPPPTRAKAGSAVTAAEVKAKARFHAEFCESESRTSCSGCLCAPPADVRASAVRGSPSSRSRDRNATFVTDRDPLVSLALCLLPRVMCLYNSMPRQDSTTCGSGLQA